MRHVLLLPLGSLLSLPLPAHSLLGMYLMTLTTGSIVCRALSSQGRGCIFCIFPSPVPLQGRTLPWATLDEAL